MRKNNMDNISEILISRWLKYKRYFYCLGFNFEVYKGDL